MTVIDAALLHAQIARFLDHEADLLDRLALHEWLALWAPQGHYIVPIDRETTDHANALNHIHDDADMRRQRVERLLGGLAPSASPPTRTVRAISRLRVDESAKQQFKVSSSMIIVGYKRQAKFIVAADVTHMMQRAGDTFRIAGKQVLLIDSDEPLGDMSFIL
jgi:3-phenylpropionate/cinnamic acid dioxygenase small subunit